MRQGGFCDCEVLYNVLDESRLKAEYWTARAGFYAISSAHGVVTGRLHAIAV